MGIDAEIWIVAPEPASDELMAALRAVPHVFKVFAVNDGYPVRRGSVATVTSLLRYFGPGYERGWWPHLREMIVDAELAASFLLPDATVYYGGDCGDATAEVTPELLAELDALWAADPRSGR